jgi:hypothetical protein
MVLFCHSWPSRKLDVGLEGNYRRKYRKSEKNIKSKEHQGFINSCHLKLDWVS